MKTENTDTATTTTTTTMGGSRFATLVMRNGLKVLIILANMFTEWVLIILLLCSNCFSYLIRKFTACFGLEPPCLWCTSSRVLDPYKSLQVCENHDSEISSSLTYFCEKTSEMKEIEAKEDGGVIVTEGDTNNNNDRKVMKEGKQVAVKELHNYAGGEQIENGTKQEEAFVVERVESEDDACLAIQKLKSELETESKALYVELEAERSAAAIAANQTMAMIRRLQEEKSAMQMEALQYQRVMEEQAEYDQKAIQLLNELVLKRDIEKQELEMELDLYRQRVSDYEAKEKAMTLIRKCVDNDSVDSDSDVLSIDLNCRYNKDENENMKEISLQDCSKEWGEIEDSLEELETERLAIMKQLKDLDKKLNQSEKEEEIEPTSELCSQEVNLVSSCFSNHVTVSEDHQPKTMASVARKLLDLVESESDGGETDQDEATFMTSNNQLGVGSKRVAIEKEMNHVYGRLQALETDTQFLRHCIGSVNQGNTGLILLQEILQHLRELRAA